MPSLNKRIVAVDGGIHNTDEGMTGATGMITFRTEPVAPESERVFVKSISVRGRYFGPNPKDPITNNKMELMGFSIVASNLVDELHAKNEKVDQEGGSTEVEFWSDSQYALGILFRPKWVPKKNQLLVRNIKSKLDDLTNFAAVSGKFIRGHKGYFINEFADLVAGLAIRRRKDVTHELAFKAIEECCLFCHNFPCKAGDNGLFGMEQIKKWKDRFDTIREREYVLPCVNKEEYDAEFTLTKSAVHDAAKDGARSGS